MMIQINEAQPAVKHLRVAQLKPVVGQERRFQAEVDNRVVVVDVRKDGRVLVAQGGEQ